MRFFASLYSLAASNIDYRDPFLVQYELPNPTDERTRMYVVFNGVEEYEKYRYKYNTCHEVFISSQGWNKEDDVEGHPAFDIDAPLGTLSPGWKERLERSIEDVLCTMFPRKTPEIREILSDHSNFVWMRSETEEKISHHLVVKNITFTQWRWASIIMFRLLKKDHPYLDDAIARVAGSLRMVFNSKVGGKPLVFESDHQFSDSLVMIHEANMDTVGLFLMSGDIERSLLTVRDISKKTDFEPLDEAEQSDYLEAFEKLDRQFDTGLTLGEEENGYLSLPRLRPGTCPISGRTHDKVGGYLFSRNGKIFFGCHRKCSISHSGREYRTIDITPYSGRLSEMIAKGIPKEIEELDQ